MTDFDTLARSATRELLDRSAPDLPARYAELKRIRGRRTAAKLAAVAAAVALAAGGWQLVGSHSKRVTPAPPPPTQVTNGALLAQPSGTNRWATLLGDPPAHLPSDAVRNSVLQFTSDGSAAVYYDRQHRLAVWDLATGAKRPLAPCPHESCYDVSASPDLSTIAYASGSDLQLQSVTTGEVTTLSLASPLASRPEWSSDGARLAFASSDGIYTAAVDGSDVRQVYERREVGQMWTSVAWSPDSSRIAFLDTALQPKTHGYSETLFTAMTVRADGTDPTTLHDAGACFCAGLTPPSLTWSPDGSQVVVVATKMTSGAAGVYTVHPDGSGWHAEQFGYYAQPAWQPVIE